ncbi:hypothetical protein [Acidisoma sp. 7E03]
MSEDQLRYAIAASIRNALSLKRETAGKGGHPINMAELQAKAVAYAEGIILPAIERQTAEAARQAVFDACAPWSRAQDCSAAPSPAIDHPLVWVWMGGALATVTALAEMLGLQVDWNADLSFAQAETPEEAIRAELDSLLDGAGIVRGATGGTF